LDTLLGPEGTDMGELAPGWGGLTVMRPTSDRTGEHLDVVGVMLPVGCLLFEICIVDASIFVAKFFRAHGGCLGIRSR
jgi:hypothetical protein